MPLSRHCCTLGRATEGQSRIAGRDAGPKQVRLQPSGMRLSHFSGVDRLAMNGVRVVFRAANDVLRFGDSLRLAMDDQQELVGL